MAFYKQTVRAPEISLLFVDVTNALNYLYIFSRTNLSTWKEVV
jgi:hypothetical protein